MVFRQHVYLGLCFSILADFIIFMYSVRINALEGGASLLMMSKLTNGILALSIFCSKNLIIDFNYKLSDAEMWTQAGWVQSTTAASVLEAVAHAKSFFNMQYFGPLHWRILSLPSRNTQMSYKVILDMLSKKILANINFEPTELAFSKDDKIVLNVFDDICFKKVFWSWVWKQSLKKNIFDNWSKKSVFFGAWNEISLTKQKNLSRLPGLIFSGVFNCFCFVRGCIYRMDALKHHQICQQQAESLMCF